MHQIAALYFHGATFAIFGWTGRTDLFFNALCRCLANQKIMGAADIADNRLVHFIAANPHGTGIDDAAQRHDRNFGCAATKIDHHRSGWLGHRQAGPDCRGHWLLNQENLTRAGTLGRFLNGPTLNGS